MWISHIGRRNAIRWPDAYAVVDAHQRLTHRELDERATRLAGALARDGIGRGERVALLSSNRVEVLETQVALSRLGATVVALNPTLTSDELAHALALAEAGAAVGERAPLSAASDAARLSVVLAFEDDRYCRAVRGCDGYEGRWDGDPDSLAAVLFSSATTGRAKAIALAQHALRASTLHWLAGGSSAPGTVLLLGTPLHHSTLTVAIGHLAAGGTLVLAGQLTPQRCLELIEAERVTHAYMVPSLIRFCLEARALQRTDVSSLRELIHGAAPMPDELRAQAADAFGATLRDCYGQAEAGGPITLGDGRARGSVGEPLPGVEVRVVDGTEAVCPPDQLGDIQVRAASRMAGYLGDDEASRAALAPMGWLRTGDLGHLDGGGRVHLSDRRVDLIIHGGQNVYPAEIERVLNAEPAVRECAVVAMDDEHWGQVPVAFVVLADHPGADDVVDRLRARARHRLAAFKRPATFRVLDELPRNQAGKVLKRELRIDATAPHEEGRAACNRL